MKKKVSNKCAICGNPVTHKVLIEIRDKQGPALNPREEELMRVCEKELEHTNFNFWITDQEWHRVRVEWKKAGIFLQKRFSNILFKPLH